MRFVLLIALVAGIFLTTFFVATRFTTDGQSSGTESPQWTPTFTPAACEFEMPAGQVEGETVHCGTVEVLQEHSRPDSRGIRLAVAVFKATGSSAQPDPLVYLQGGPGLATLGVVTPLFTLDFARPIQQAPDIVFVDQRGTGQSVPLLQCDELRGATPGAEPTDGSYRSRLGS